MLGIFISHTHRDPRVADALNMIERDGVAADSPLDETVSTSSA
jgi:hypothetical protein